MSGATRRRAYLEAMGIQGWVRRAAAPPAEGEAVSETPAADGPPPSAAEPSPAAGPAATGHAPGMEATPTSSAPDVPPPFTDEPPLPTEEAVPSAFDAPPSARDAGSEAPPAIDVSGLDWDALQAAVAGCTACALHATRTQTVFGTGDRNADWMVVGEAPGADEDRQGEPFVGRAGQLLDNMLRAIGLQRGQVYIANVIKCRPPNNRNPHAGEIAQCLGYLRRQVELVQPKLILVVGASPPTPCLASRRPWAGCAARCIVSPAFRWWSPTIPPTCCARRATRPRAGTICVLRAA